MPKTHYIAMSGMRGYMPDHCDVYPDLSGAVDDLEQLFDLSERKSKILARDRFLPLTREDGAEYCEISECSCPDPQIHSEEPIDREWFGLDEEEEE